MKTLFGTVTVCALLLGCPLSLLAQGEGHLKVKVDPGRAGVFVDGKYVGPAANFRVGRTYALPAGEHEIKLVDPRYEEMTTKVEIVAGKTFVLRQQMKPLPAAQPPFGSLRVKNAGKFDAVYVDGEFVGHADEFSNRWQDLQLKPGEYTVKVVPASGGTAHEEKVTIEANKTTIVKPIK